MHYVYFFQYVLKVSLMMSP